ncbi:serine-rich adhesin for platelets-like isoform X2 [Leucoraja erinacea]|uniref:serine-rich adhesin for platelets-like isoform X2 n=1 Tax=Leucoraja erinaceus TaxID=7782 RepID=UPI002455F6A9|nr:serine-rich adhesin for platelets-like isoform X2 [Leucoraja erinacea]
MSTLWCLENESKGHRFTFILCLLGFLAQWSCHSYAEPIESPIAITTVNPTANNQTAVLDTNTTTANTSMNSITTLGIESANSSVETSTVLMRDGVTQLSEGEHNAVQSQIKDDSSRAGTPVLFQDDSSRAGTPVVFTSLLVCGLLAAAGILTGSYLCSRKKWTPPSRRLDEETDAQDRDSVMFSVAAEDRDKPKVNGETQETGDKSLPASAAGTAPTTVTKGRLEGDTEL